MKKKKVVHTINKPATVVEILKALGITKQEYDETVKVIKKIL